MSTLYTPDLITLNYTRRHRRLQDNESLDDELLKTFISESSTEFASALMRTPHPYVDTHFYDAPYSDGQRDNFGVFRELEVNADLLAITTLMNGDTTTIAPTGYVLEDANEYPKWQIRMKWDNQFAFTFNDNPQQAISVLGVWGYVPHYLRCWKQLTTLGEAIADNLTTSVTLTSAAGIEIGHYGLIGNEQVKVLDIADKVLIVEREVNGTTAAAHDTALPFKVFDQLPDIKGAVVAMTAYKYLHKDQIGSRVSVIDNGVVQVDDLDPQVQKTIDRHSRPKIMGVFR